MNEDAYRALTRTALLVATDIFDPSADRRIIVDGLRATTARIVADRASLNSPAGQAAVVTLFAQLAMMGIQLELDVPDVELLVPQPPVRGDKLASGLLDYGNDLLPGGSSRPSAKADVVFAVGGAHAKDDAVRVSGGPWHASVGCNSPMRPWRGDVPVGAMAAAAAAAAEGLRAAVPRIAECLDRPAPVDFRWHRRRDRRVKLDLRRYRIEERTRLGDVDMISGGAITNAALFVLLRMPGISGSMRIVEPDRLDISNLNRYSLARFSMLSRQKIDSLAVWDSMDLRITGLAEKLETTTLAELAPMARRILVGVDHIPSRWVAQRAAGSGWVCVGSSSHDFVLVSSHAPGTPCAGCVHPVDDSVDVEIPTISFVSFWAGLVQALELISEAGGRAPSWTRSTNIWPLGLENPHGFHQFQQAAVTNCPVGCYASAHQRAA